LKPANIHIAGEGLPIEEKSSHPAGTLFSGGYDADTNELFLSGVIGHPGGIAAAGGDPSAGSVSGLRVLLLPSGDVFWADDSMSLPRRLSPEEIKAVQKGLEIHFRDRSVRHVSKLEEISKSSNSNLPS